MKNYSKMQNKNNGFTLLELMVAMVIFSLMSVMAYSALAAVFKSNEVVSEQELRLKKLQRSMMFIERDFRQLVLRPKSSGYGQPPLPALDSGLDSEGVIEFTRAGNSNPMEMSRSSLQRVRYTVEDKKLSRLSWNIVDSIDVEPVKMLLLDNVELLSFRFLDGEKNKNSWKENWASLTKNPIAIELTIEHKNWGKIVRLFSIQ